MTKAKTMKEAVDAIGLLELGHRCYGWRYSIFCYPEHYEVVINEKHRASDANPYKAALDAALQTPTERQ